MSIIEDNKNIAKFMNYDVTEFHYRDNLSLIFGNEDSAFDFENINYFNPNKNWNLLMEIIKKINNTGCIVEISYSIVTTCRICYIGNKYDKAINFINDNNGGLEPIEAVYNSVVEFINFYMNKNGK
jgi:hypothetical protein